MEGYPRQEEGIKRIKKFFTYFSGFELSEDDGFLTIRILQNRYPNAVYHENGAVEQNVKILEELLELYRLPFNKIEFHDYISYNLEIKGERS